MPINATAVSGPIRLPRSPQELRLLAQFAGQAMQVILARDGPPQSSVEREAFATQAYDMAEAMVDEHRRRS